MRLTVTGVAAAAAMLAAFAGPAAAQDECVIKVGRVVPMTGPLLDMGRETPWLDENKVDPINAAGGLQVGDQKCKIEYTIYDSKGTAAGAGEAAQRAILDDKVDVVMAQGTPDTTNPPSDLCERYEVPCITSDTPIEAWSSAPTASRKKLEETHHFFFPVPDLVKNHIGMIKAPPGDFNGRIGYLYRTTRTARCSRRCSTRPSRGPAGSRSIGPLRAGLAGLLGDHRPVQAGSRRGRDGRSGTAGSAELSAAGGAGRLQAEDVHHREGHGLSGADARPGEYGVDILSVNFGLLLSPASRNLATMTAPRWWPPTREEPRHSVLAAAGLVDASWDVLFDALQRAGSKDRDEL